jgi:hypothetical protein
MGAKTSEDDYHHRNGKILPEICPYLDQQR